MARKAKRKRSAKAVAHFPESPVARRASLKLIASYGAGAMLVAGGGTAFALDFRKKLTEADLSVIGNGTPTIVQIHDPGCTLCRALQKETRAAFKLCEDTAPQYRVANIHATDGAAFQARYGLPHVTLVFLNGAGALQHTIQGVTPAEDIKAAITRVFA